MGYAHTGSTVKGRPPLEPRIKELEKQVDTLLNILKSLSDRVERDAVLMGGLDDRLRHLEVCLKRDAQPYEPLFDRWPGGVTGR